LNLAQQALGLQRLFPATRPDIRGTQLVWTATLIPTPLSRNYTIRIRYSIWEYPRVFVIDPLLRPDPNEYLPHFYSEEGCLCLHEYDEWDASMLIALTIVPWASEWLAHYELWKGTGLWYGDAEPPEDGTPTSWAVPAEAGGSNGSRAARRQQRHRELRTDRPPARPSP
jgi:hypothetical protein